MVLNPPRLRSAEESHRLYQELKRRCIELEPDRVLYGSSGGGPQAPPLPRLFYKLPVPEEFKGSVDPYAAMWVALSDEERRRWRGGLMRTVTAFAPEPAFTVGFRP